MYYICASVCMCMRAFGVYTTMRLTYCMENEKMLMKHLKNRIVTSIETNSSGDYLHVSTIAAINFHIRWDIDHRLYYVPHYEMPVKCWMLPCALNEMYNRIHRCMEKSERVNACIGTFSGGVETERGIFNRFVHLHSLFPFTSSILTM